MSAPVATHVSALALQFAHHHGTRQRHHIIEIIHAISQLQLSDSLTPAERDSLEQAIFDGVVSLLCLDRCACMKVAMMIEQSCSRCCSKTGTSCFPCLR